MARSTNSPRADADRPKRRLLRVGPGLIIALGISIFIGGRWISAEKQVRAARSGPPIVERQVISSSYQEKIGPTPEVGFILERRDILGLDAAQVAKLEKLQSEWEKVYGPKIAEANAAAARTQEYLANARGNPRTPVAHIQKEAAPVIALSAEISAARRSCWGRAVGILTSDQLKIIQAEREAAWSAKTKASSAKDGADDAGPGG